MHHLRLIFQRFQEYGIRINPSKCNFGQPEVNFLGYRITAQGTQPMEDKVSAIVNFPKPSTVQEMRRFLAMNNFYRRFISRASETQAPLFQFLKGAKKNDKRQIIWTEEAEKAFQQCKNDLATQPILAHPSSSATISLAVDASDSAIGGVLEQIGTNVPELQPLLRYIYRCASTIRASQFQKNCVQPVSSDISSWNTSDAEITRSTIRLVLHEDGRCNLGKIMHRMPAQ
ncbi:hypothetical protein JTE90_025329 [Oedothorax gibbosus]|uniref:RNA-directed DNA polymerase n=1 Tax=Oedothorax gibbosus TaxID=931172 RepID=A0AAV6V824_9ARAC|nr:hypothetical protein JTE90_025329 [Oedothorax gibbosus]